MSTIRRENEERERSTNDAQARTSHVWTSGVQQRRATRVRWFRNFSKEEASAHGRRLGSRHTRKVGTPGATDNFVFGNLVYNLGKFVEFVGHRIFFMSLAYASRIPSLTLPVPTRKQPRPSKRLSSPRCAIITNRCDAFRSTLPRSPRPAAPPASCCTPFCASSSAAPGAPRSSTPRSDSRSNERTL